MKVLVTGGAGYIGSTIAAALEESGHTPVIVDNLVRGRREFLGDRPFYQADISDEAALATIVADHPDLAVTVHCAALIVVPESVADPVTYYKNNVSKSLTMFETLVRLGKPRIVFSSSASVYAAPSESLEVDESSPVDPLSPYGRTKLMMEQILTDVAAATNLRALLLRYFNPIGSDPRLRSGVYDRVPSHVLGQILAASRGDIPHFSLTGTDYPTRDGTGMRDYIHVWDVARAHVAAVERFDDVLAAEGAPSTILNLGTGSGTTVRELVAAFEAASGRPVPLEEAPRRPGDAAGSYANVDKAHRLLGWTAESSLESAISSALDWGERRTELLPDLA